MTRWVAACFLAVDSLTGAIAGYHTLSACHVRLEDVALDWQGSGPAPVVPAARLGGLAIDLRYQGRKIAAALLGDAMARGLRSDIAAHDGCRCEG